MRLFPQRTTTLATERQRLSQFDPATWRDADGNAIAPMADEPTQWVTDEDFAALLRGQKAEK